MYLYLNSSIIKNNENNCTYIIFFYEIHLQHYFFLIKNNLHRYLLFVIILKYIWVIRDNFL